MSDTSLKVLLSYLITAVIGKMDLDKRYCNKIKKKIIIKGLETHHSVTLLLYFQEKKHVLAACLNMPTSGVYIEHASEPMAELKKKA